MDIAKLYQLFINSKGICTDTRKLKPNTIFFALKGENFNGNEYALQALETGCNYAIIDEQIEVKNDALNHRLIKVTSGLKTLQKLANYHRKQFNIPVIGITGSNGKTTTKELIGEVLKQKYEILITQGNLNNHIGVPLTLLNLNSKHQIAIIEMGANKPGDINELATIAEPNYGLLTNIGKAHIEGFGSYEGVLKTKLELYKFIEKQKGTIIYNLNDEVLENYLPKNCKLYTYAITNQKADINGDLIEFNPCVNFKWHNTQTQYISPPLKSNLVGEYNLTNILAAICVGHIFDVSVDKINNAIENYTPSNNRSQITKTKNNTLIVDCYNANPTSMLSALSSFKINPNPKLVILGDMLELGHISETEHQKIADWLVDNNIQAYLIGDEFYKTNTKFKTFKNTTHFIKNIDLKTMKNHIILLKGSRGIKLESLIELL
ncbi:MAG TPA: UDP-N-acetylmuramoyl-tripeptide--D-alanyl-D-alanine ligase [Crocinitomix sp.]|nr:UDP-N-acetylmuramoyl-tripeptide--D-alanyl-D-alanine ligase [Crocinitomix sp.]